MKKLIIATLFLLSSSSIFAQLDTKLLAKEYADMFILAERVADQTDKVVADEESGIGFKKANGLISLERTLDKRSNVNTQFLFKLVKPNGKKIPLDKIMAEKVIKKFNGALIKMEASLKEEHGAQVQEILDDLFN